MKIEGITMKESIELTQIAIILLVMVMRWYMLLLGPRSTLLLSASSGFVFVVCCLLRNATFPQQLGRVNSKTMDCFKGAPNLQAEISCQARISGPKPKFRPGILAWKKRAKNLGLKFQARISSQNFRSKFQAKKSV